MIKLTRLNGQEFFLNPDHLLMLEKTPDTLLMLTTQEKLTVKESVEEITQDFINFKKQIHIG